ncbi:MAG: SAM-dependent methyltransferase, partial [Chloroflexi bacterium]|nr:SAM-dependent methyltransferase [Chloroflexota bacterium]
MDVGRARQLVRDGKFQELFVEELGWDHFDTGLTVQVGEEATTLQAIAQKRGMVAYLCSTRDGQRLPDYAGRRKIEHQVAKAVREHLIIFTDETRTVQVWQWVKREPGRPTACREHSFHTSQSGQALVQKLQAIAFTLDEEERLTLTDVTRRARSGFDVERVTKRFYDQFKKEHAAFLKLITGITDSGDHEWYASVMLNRMMFVYFIQRKGFLDGDVHYLRNRLQRCREQAGRDKFYSFYRYFLLRLFHEGLGGVGSRTPQLDELLGRIPYLNGGLFERHEVEARYPAIQIPDKAFERIFAYFDQYQWHLDERPLRHDYEINPDVLGYIFEKYINQKQMGAYYTKEDITEYISKSTVVPFLLDAARAKCRVAFENPNGPTVWDLLREDPDRYIYPAVRHSVTWDVHTNRALEQPFELPAEIALGLDTGKPDLLERRKGWNRPAPPEYALPTEIWREVVARRARYVDVRGRLVRSEVRDANDLITLNLDIRQFAQDTIGDCEGPDLLRAFWHAIEKVTVLDPTCGSGAFLFAALNILEPLYEGCLERMEAFVEDLDRSGEKHRPEKLSDFRQVLERVKAHPNRRYFIFKSIILNNLFGVDIMDEAVEICKLRLFLKLAAQVEPDPKHRNLGIEPLPDIDFNIKVGNSLVGFASHDEVQRAGTAKFDFDNAMEKMSVRVADLQQAFDAFRYRQIEGDGSVPIEHKLELRKRLTSVREEVNGYLAGEYGVAQTKKDAYAKWMKSHQPFDW